MKSGNVFSRLFIQEFLCNFPQLNAETLLIIIIYTDMQIKRYVTS